MGKARKDSFPFSPQTFLKATPLEDLGWTLAGCYDGGGQPHEGMVPGSVLFTAGLHPILSPTTRHVPGKQSDGEDRKAKPLLS